MNTASDGSELADDLATPRIARPTRFDEVIPALGAIAVWIAFMAPQGWRVAVESVWLLVLGLLLAAWTLLMRLRYDRDTFAMTVGPWRRKVALSDLESVTWKRTGGGRSRGTIYLRDRAGHRAPIYVGRFKGRPDWGPFILDAAERASASVDARSRAYLDGRMPENAQVH